MSVRLDYWFSIEKLYYRRCWDEFARAAEEVVTGNDTLPHFFKMLSVAHSRRGNKDKALRALRSGIAKHPNDPLCYSALGTMLACASRNKPDLRRDAIENWRKALNLSSNRVDLQEQLQEELEIVRDLPADGRYPVVSQAVQTTIEIIRGCGLLFGRNLDDVVALLADELGTACLRNDWIYPGEILSIDDEAYISLEYAFKSEISLSTIARLAGIFITDIKEGFADGARQLKFSVGSQTYNATVRVPEDMICLINDWLSNSGRTRLFYQIDDGKGHLREFLLISQIEADALRKSQLLPKVAPPQRQTVYTGI